jgi:hypothetical protein
MNLSPDSQTSPAELLHRIQDLFRDLGLGDQKLTLTHAGQKFLVSCDALAFTVYRLNENSHVPPGVPGWPVCLVTAETVVDESSPPHFEEDDFSSGLTLPQWLDLIKETFRK